MADNTIIVLLILLALFTGYYSATGTKSQMIRIVDVFIIGPIMIYLGIRGYNLTGSLLYLVLVFLGASTISYNLRNYIITKNSKYSEN